MFTPIQHMKGINFACDRTIIFQNKISAFKLRKNEFGMGNH